MWTVVYVAKNREVAKKIISALETYGLLAKMHALGDEEEKDTSYEVMVPESEVEKAHTIIIDLDF